MRAAVTAAILALVSLPFVPALSTGRAGQQEKQNRSEFMRRKLEFSKNVLEGLALEQYPMIEKNAKALKILSQAAEWEVPMIPNATDYVALTSEFQRNTDELVKAAKQGNIDGATLAYVKLTMNCVQCHKYVRFASQ
jgi:cytochrome c556